MLRPASVRHPAKAGLTRGKMVALRGGGASLTLLPCLMTRGSILFTPAGADVCGAFSSLSSGTGVPERESVSLIEAFGARCLRQERFDRQQRVQLTSN